MYLKHGTTPIQTMDKLSLPDLGMASDGSMRTWDKTIDRAINRHDLVWNAIISNFDEIAVSETVELTTHTSDSRHNMRCTCRHILAQEILAVVSSVNDRTEVHDKRWLLTDASIELWIGWNALDDHENAPITQKIKIQVNDRCTDISSTSYSIFWGHQRGADYVPDDRLKTSLAHILRLSLKTYFDKIDQNITPGTSTTEQNRVVQSFQHMRYTGTYPPESPDLPLED